MLKAFAIGILLSMTLLGVACSDDDNGTDGDAGSERDEFIQDAEDQISDLRAELERLRDDLSDGDAGAEIEQQADQLQSRINEAEAELDKVRNAGEDEWEDLKDSVDQTLSDAGDLVDAIGSELGID